MLLILKLNSVGRVEVWVWCLEEVGIHVDPQPPAEGGDQHGSARAGYCQLVARM